MTEAEQVHDENIVSNVTHMQAKADEAVTSLRERLAKLHAIALSAVAGAGGIAASEAELYGELSRELSEELSGDFSAAMNGLCR